MASRFAFHLSIWILGLLLAGRASLWEVPRRPPRLRASHCQSHKARHGSVPLSVPAHSVQAHTSEAGVVASQKVTEGVQGTVAIATGPTLLALQIFAADEREHP